VQLIDQSLKIEEPRLTLEASDASIFHGSTIWTGALSGQGDALSFLPGMLLRYFFIDTQGICHHNSAMAYLSALPRGLDPIKAC
jgi:hypothetical protein